MPRSAEDQSKLSAILWAVLGYFGKKRTNREHLPAPGDEQIVDLQITGKIGRKKIDEKLKCALIVGHPQQKADTTAAKPLDVIAYLLSRFEDSDRHQVEADLASGWNASETVPQVSDEIQAEAKQLLEDLRTKRTKTVAGSVTARVLD